MRHRVKKEKLSMKKDHRISLLRNLTDDLVVHGKVNTTLTRAKMVSARADRMIALAKAAKTDMEAIRAIAKYLHTKSASRRTIIELRDRYKDRTSGFTRITKMGIRAGDGAPKALIELI